MSVALNVSEASHLSKVPSMDTEAFTTKLILLTTGVILYTGAPAEEAFCRLRESSVGKHRAHQQTKCDLAQNPNFEMAS